MPTARRLFFAVLGILFLAATTQAILAAETPQKQAFVRLDRVTASRPLPTGIEIHAGPAILQITALRDDILRVRVTPAGSLPEDASWAVLPESRTASVPVTPENSGAAVGFKTAKLRVSIHKDPLELHVTDLAGHIIAEDFPGRPIEYHGNSFRVYMKSPADEHYFGLGDKPGPLDRRNEAFTDWNTDAFGWQESTDPIYKAIPYFITLRRGVAAGVFLDNTWRTSFDFNKEYRDAYSFGSENGPLDYYIVYGPEPESSRRILGLAHRQNPSPAALVARLPAVALQLLPRNRSPPHRQPPSLRAHPHGRALAGHRLSVEESTLYC